MKGLVEKQKLNQFLMLFSLTLVIERTMVKYKIV